MFQKTLLIAAVVATAFCGTAQAQSTPAKKELVARILKAQQPGIENMANALVQDAAGDLMNRAGAALQQRVPADKREAVGNDITNDVRKFVQEATPIVRDDALKIAPSTVGALLEEKFNEDELKQIASILENPTFVKFQSVGNDMQKVLVEKLLADTRPLVQPKLVAAEQAIAKRLGIPANNGGQAPAAGAKPPAGGKAKK